jgi:hypothetical protein
VLLALDLEVGKAKQKENENVSGFKKKQVCLEGATIRPQGLVLKLPYFVKT